MEELAIYDSNFVYVKGPDNTVADALSRYPNNFETSSEDTEKKALHPYCTNGDGIPLITILNKENCETITPLDCVAALATAPNKEAQKQIVMDEAAINRMRQAYNEDPWC